MQQPYVVSRSWCFADRDTKLAAVAVNRGRCGTVLNFNKAWPCLFVDVQNTVLPPRRSPGASIRLDEATFGDPTGRPCLPHRG